MYSFKIKKILSYSCKDTGCRFLQSPFWALFKSEHNWKNEMFDVNVANIEKNECIGSDSFSFQCSVLIRTFGKAGMFFSLAYIPMMIELPYINLQPIEQVRPYVCLLTEFSEALKAYLPSNTLCVRYDLPIDFLTFKDRNFFVDSLKIFAYKNHLKLLKTKVDIQPPDTVLLDITKPANTILANMKNKWRYNIRLAEKKNVIVKVYRAGDDVKRIENALDVFYSLYETTAERDGIALHSKQYYWDLIKLSTEERKNTNAPLISLYIASHEGDDLAAIITLFSRFEAVYLYGASSNIKRNLMPAYLLQWTAINDAKQYGSPLYDFYGIPPTDNKNHPMFGLYLFKTGFGGTIIHRPGSFDVPLHRFYSLYIKAEEIRAFYHKRVKKLFVGRIK